jgi:carbonic anhydrase
MGGEKKDKVIPVQTCSTQALTKVSGGGEESLQKLMEGNKRHLAGEFTLLHRLEDQRIESAKGQHPFAVILGCSDSRVPPEIIFDQTFGNLFVVRVAGNIVHAAGLGSIEYAVMHLRTPLVIVLGHTRCGAVAATIEGGEAPGHIYHIVEAIKPAVDAVQGQPGDLLDNAVRANVRRTVGDLKSSYPVLAILVREGKLKIMGAYYNLDTGKVDIID